MFQGPQTFWSHHHHRWIVKSIIYLIKISIRLGRPSSEITTCQLSHSLYQMVRKSKQISSETLFRDLSARWMSRIYFLISQKHVTHPSIIGPNAILAHHCSPKLHLKLIKPLFSNLLLKIEKLCSWLWDTFRTKGALRHDPTVICITHQAQKQLKCRSILIIKVQLGCLIIMSSNPIRRFWWLIMRHLKQIITWCLLSRN